MYMVKIWAKIVTDDKLVKDVIYSKDVNFTTSKFLDYLIDICYELDVPTPVILKSHKSNFNKFNIVKFRKIDFVESINFDSLVLENAAE